MNSSDIQPLLATLLANTDSVYSKAKLATGAPAIVTGIGIEDCSVLLDSTTNPSQCLITVNRMHKSTSRFVGGTDVVYNQQVEINVISKAGQAICSELADLVEDCLHDTNTVAYGGSTIGVNFVNIGRMPLRDENFWRDVITFDVLGIE